MNRMVLLHSRRMFRFRHHIRKSRIDLQRTAELLHEPEHRVDMGRVDVHQAPHLLHGGEQRVDLERPTVLEVLQH